MAAVIPTPPGLSCCSEPESATHSRERRRVAVVAKEIEKVLSAKMDATSVQFSIIVERLQIIASQVAEHSSLLGMMAKQIESRLDMNELQWNKEAVQSTSDRIGRRRY